MTRFHRLPLVSALSAAAVLLAACGTTTDLSENKAPVETRPTADANANANATPQSKVATVELSARDAAAAAAAKARTVYFDFDSYVVKDEYKPVIDANAKFLTLDKSVRLTAEGHTDERGGREYNLALGQKRAEAVVKALQVMGAAAGQVEPVSFGKERPADPGHDEAAWSKNRRVELKDK
ncbi:peptidoglycan-associated lipoprotein Pal [Rubrivivax sp. JA1055]|uniref:peptidoglycan-associated lipoprotein Pal n=1 Tax=Rubrivivax sp. JA1055 TaxID=2894194 RepID=UPI001E317FFF|nr:peptidoglycan-associated lipoprotein Pal [Rubrivivax sp. JA1055]MCC9598831.1 peptidoglycan-associated lipoprotein Pal [Rubrivivax sp. JA1055]